MSLYRSIGRGFKTRRLKPGELFSGVDCSAGANFSTRTALDASVGIDVIDIAFRDSFNGANGKTSSASYTVIIDYVSHGCKCLDKNYTILLFILCKNKAFLRINE